MISTQDETSTSAHSSNAHSSNAHSSKMMQQPPHNVSETTQKTKLQPQATFSYQSKD